MSASAMCRIGDCMLTRSSWRCDRQCDSHKRTRERAFIPAQRTAKTFEQNSHSNEDEERARLEQALEEGLLETFPASDAVSVAVDGSPNRSGCVSVCFQNSAGERHPLDPGGLDANIPIAELNLVIRPVGLRFSILTSPQGTTRLREAVSSGARSEGASRSGR